MLLHAAISTKELHKKIRGGEICFGGNIKFKIYGTLQCASGKRMKKENRIFFASEVQACENGYRPCGHCMKEGYKKWKNEFK
jgi:methylphosphotriester-DNA--protein-cysteine methyltransferase